MCDFNMLEYSVLRLISKDEHFVDVRVPFGSMETICRWFINDHNDFVIQIVGRGFYDIDSYAKDEVFCNLDEKEKENKDGLP